MKAKANFIFSDLNPCGGAERLTLVTMQAVLEMGIDIDLTTLAEPDKQKIENTYGKDLASVLDHIKKMHVLQILDEKSISDVLKNNYDIIINTHGDIDPYYDKSFSKNNAITYCHFPTGKSLIENNDKVYLEKHLKLRLSDSDKDIKNKLDEKKYRDWLKYAYDNQIRNTTLVTNSEYVRKKIFETYWIDDTIVLYPPVDVDIFHNAVNFSNTEREDVVLVVSRIDPGKKVDNAIVLAKLLKEKGIGNGMIIAGNYDPYFHDYYSNLKKMIVDYGLTDYITFEIDVTLDKLLSHMKKTKVYFHPKPDEHFGISIAEAMSAGLTPVVFDIGGQTEFVPSKYQFKTLEQAAQIIKSAFNASDAERISISNLANRFSASNYKKEFQKIVNNLL